MDESTRQAFTEYLVSDLLYTFDAADAAIEQNLTASEQEEARKLLVQWRESFDAWVKATIK